MQNLCVCIVSTSRGAQQKKRRRSALESGYGEISNPVNLLTTLLLAEKVGSTSRTPVKKELQRLETALLQELDLTCAHGTQAIDTQMVSPKEFILEEVFLDGLASDWLAARPTPGSNHGSRC